MTPLHDRLPPLPETTRESALRAWGWFLLKNVAGWTLILTSVVVGPFIPGPGGIPLFLMGFALITFPGKRRLTARVMRGRTFGRPPLIYSLIVFAISLLLPAVGAILLLYLTRPRAWLEHHVHNPDLVTLELYLVLALMMWLLLRLAPRGANLLLPWMPVLRRKIRPWLRDRGIHLLPPRTRHRDAHGLVHYTDGILVITDKFSLALARFWKRYLWWMIALSAAAGTALGYWLWR
jgi:hypothetical protein